MKFLLWKLILLILAITCVLQGQVKCHNCKVSFHFQKVCHRVLVNDVCQPPVATKSCRRLKTTINDARCPVYDCVSMRVCMVKSM